MLPIEASESKHSQQFSYVDGKLQKIQRRLLEVHAACEQVVRLHVHGNLQENQSKQQSELLGLYRRNTLWLLQLLVEAISRIVQLQACSAAPPREEALSKEPLAPAIPSPLQEKPVEEEAPKLSERLDCYEKQIQALETIIQQQTEAIEQVEAGQAGAIKALNDGYYTISLSLDDLKIDVSYIGEEKLTTEIYFSSPNWWNQAGAATYVQLDSEPQQKMAELRFCPTVSTVEGYKYWSISIDDIDQYSTITFLRCSASGDDWGARTGAISLQTRGPERPGQPRRPRA